MQENKSPRNRRDAGWFETESYLQMGWIVIGISAGVGLGLANHLFVHGRGITKERLIPYFLVIGATTLLGNWLCYKLWRWSKRETRGKP